MKIEKGEKIYGNIEHKMHDLDEIVQKSIKNISLDFTEGKIILRKNEIKKNKVSKL